LKPSKIHGLEQTYGPSSHELSHERDTGRSIGINHVVPRVAFIDHVISQSSSSALANYEA